uniref:NADH dehydrogenase subunit 2 n=1 Tax=Nematus hequensis TaxID=1848120 RepID=UPI0023D7BD6E|nr:NADH dehydrogenase subunit 2 [Nematus hequensis]WDQ45602.1 NADH dehydrogenase subunit 2 [Nematus hequensis]
MTKNFIFFKNNSKFKLNNFKLLFFITMIFSTMISINSNSWINAWMGMEINLMSFIPLMMSSNKKKSSNSTMIYFIVQAMASSLILLSTLLMKIEINLVKLNMMYSLIQFSLLMKLGAAPLHWWTPKIFMNLNWKIGFNFLTWQKIAPIMLLNTSINNNLMIYMMMISSILTGAILGMNQTMIKLIMIYSSINHMGWMLMALMMNMSLMIMYFIIYSMMNLMICLLMNNMNIDYLNQLFKNNNQNLFFKILTLSMFLSLGGMPPFLGFMPKLAILITMMNNNLMMESMLFISMAMLTLSFYMNPMLAMFLSTKFSTKWSLKNDYIKKNFIMMFLINLTLSMVILPFIIKFML